MTMLERRSTSVGGAFRICPEPVGPTNSEQRPRFGAGDLADDGLVRVLRQYARAIEDGAEPAGYAPMIRTARTVQLVRICLRMRYGATFLGTHSYDRYVRHYEAPSYWLAMGIDGHRAKSGLSHVIDGRVHIPGTDLVARWDFPTKEAV